MVSPVEILQAFGNLPSVTQILKAVGLAPDYSCVPRHLLEHARQRGTALHAAIQLYHEGDLDEDALHPEVASGVSAYRKFLAESGFQFERSEFEVISERWRYVGHPDLLGRLNGGLVLLDLKYMEQVPIQAATYQLTLYQLAFSEQESESPPISACYVLQLKRDGTYRLHSVSTGAAEQRVVLAAVIVHQAVMEARER